MKHKTRIASAIAVALLMGTAQAQDASQGQAQGGQEKSKQLQGVTVTGSHIRSVDVETSQPIFTMDRQAIKATGLTNLNDILARMPSIGTPDLTPQDTLTSGMDVGGRFVNIRNLGSQRTLVLVNGRRWATSLSGMTDLSTIPVTIIDRIDILKDGASSVYGSDAIGGVVNIITREHFDGAEFNAYYGQNQQGDGQQKNADFTWGHNTKKSSFILSASYQDQSPMWDSTRALTRYPQGPRHPDTGWALGPWGRVTDPRPAGTPGAGSYDKTGQWNPNRYVIDHGNFNTGNLASYHLYDDTSNADKYNPNQDMTFRAGTSLKNLFLQERYRLTDNITLRGTASYSSRNSSSQLSGYPFPGNITPNNPGTLAPDSPYNPFPGYNTPFTLRTVDLPRITWTNSRLLHGDVGADGIFTFLNHDWNWDATYNYSQTLIRQKSSGNLYLPNVYNAINPVVGPNGQLSCADPSGGCTPWNILAGPGASRSVLDYVNYIGTSRQMSQTSDFTANIGGGLWDIPTGGTLSIAGGYEHRREKGAFMPDPNDSAGLTTNLASGPTNGRYNVNEVYLELDAPLLKELPGAQEFGVNVASRYSHYSNFGSTTNNKYSVRWRPVDDVLIRGTFAKGFRAPPLDNLYSGTGQSFDSFLDPCDSVYGASASNPAVAAHCRASGVPAGYRQKDQSGAAITNNGGGQTPVPFNVVSNPNLKPELSTTRTFGLVYSPHQADGLDFTLDYYDIRLKNTITLVAANDILNSCYVQNVPSYCNMFSRNASGAISQLTDTYLNLGSLTTQGYDIGIHYRLPETPIGQFRIASDSTYLTKYQLTTAPGTVPQNWAGFMYNQTALYRLRSNLQVDWTYKQFGASWTVRYFSGMKDMCYTLTTECSDPAYINPWIGKYGIAQKGSVTFNDLQVRYNTPWRGAVALGVNNLFNRRGPYYYKVYNYSGSPPYNPQFDADRFFYLQYNQKFDL